MDQIEERKRRLLEKMPKPAVLGFPPAPKQEHTAVTEEPSPVDDAVDVFQNAGGIVIFSALTSFKKNLKHAHC